MDFNAWVDQQGGTDEAAEILSEKPRAVASWYYGERAPGLKASTNIVRKSGNAVDFNGIYWPLAKKLFGLEKPSK